MFENTKLVRKLKLFAAGILGGLLVACGGGGDRGCANLDPARSSLLPTCASGTTPTTSANATTVEAIAPLALSLTDASSATITSVSPDRPGTLQALVKD